MSESVRKGLPDLIAAALTALKSKQAEIDRLNVYPVPDGDTGTNMVLTMESVHAEIVKAEPTLRGIAEAAKYGSLMGARGNSGVILSQIIRGFFEAVEDREEISALGLIEGLQGAARVAYQAVKKPVEGTMLTVIRDAAESVSDVPRGGVSVVDVLETAVRAGEESVARTPELLPALKEAGVVDAGGYGLVVMGKGVLAALRDEPLAMLTESPERMGASEEESLAYAYCTELVVKGTNLDKEALERRIEHLGDSMLVVGTPDLLKVHIHTNNPGRVLEAAVAMGSLSRIQINNMVEQAAERSKLLASEADTVGVVAVVSGDGIKTIFESLGAAGFVTGGQSMNPSTAEILEVVEGLKDRKVVILPNNKNVVMAAQQVRELTDKEVVVIPTLSVPGGLSAMLGFDPAKSIEDNERDMIEASEGVRSGEVTVAVRDADGVKKGDYIGLFGGSIASTGKSLLDVTVALLDKMADDSETATILAGSEVTDEEIAELLKVSAERLPGLELELHRGGQPVYHFLIGVE